MTTPGKLIIISAPSGSGKTTLARHLLSVIPSLQFSVSATTRAQRAHEVDGRDYLFMSTERFQTLQRTNAFLEWEEVYAGIFYGTLKASVDEYLKSGVSLVFDVDVQGALNIKKAYGQQALSVYVDAGGIDVLEQRLRARNTETEERLQIRLKKAALEAQMSHFFDYIQLNSHLEQACEQLTRRVHTFLSASL
ncbi:MAG: guanylate kinase [Bacteroidota bacterium]